ncbi:MAG TPA: type VII secretion protein EccB [Nocardioides sp.]|nr:type VII secretion protein EccB [Nocardioides sp.]
MTSRRDLVEAYSFSRRRLVTAFISGAPGGGEAAPSRSGRTIVAGVVVAVLVVAGAAVTRTVSPRLVEEGSSHVPPGRAAQVTGPGR